MAKNEGDRRVQRTRRMLQDACVELILEKGYSEVTIQDILDRANVGRSTFYAHYRDKEDLVASRFESLHRAFEEHLKFALDSTSMGMGEADAQANLPLFIFKYVEHEHRLVKALLGRQSGGVRVNYFSNYLLGYIRQILKTFAKAKLSEYELEAVAEYTCHSFLALLLWWVDHDMPCSVDEVYALMIRLLEPGLRDVLGVPSVWSPVAEPIRG